jgi:hypothetical protein
MINLMIALRDRIKQFLTCQTTLTQEYTANSDPGYLYVADATYFNIVFASRNYPQICAYYPSGGQTIKVKLTIKDVDVDNKILTLGSPSTSTIPIGAIIKRTPNWEEVKGFYLGDPASIPANKLPAVCVSPSNKEISWQTLTGTKEKQSFSIFTHVIEDNQDNSTMLLARITEDIEDLLNADLHIKIKRDIAGYNRTYNSLVGGTQYGYSQKGQFCKSSQINWSGDEYWSRMFIIGQDSSNFDSFE